MPSRLLVLLASTLLACGGSVEIPSPEDVSTTLPTQPGELGPEVSVTTVLPMPPTTGFGQVDEALRPFIDRAIEDLSARSEVEREAVVVMAAESVVWPDGSLGCPEPGRLYPQVQVEGYLIRLGADDLVYNYHGGGSREVFLCQLPQAR